MSDLWAELNDFSAYEKHIPCILCQKDAFPNVTLTAFKCSVCDHLFKEDGSKMDIECFCETCNPEAKKQMSGDDLGMVKGEENV